MNFEVPLFKINSMTRGGTLGKLTKKYALNGKIDLSENLFELDVLVGTPYFPLPITQIKVSSYTLDEEQYIFNSVQHLFYEQGVPREDIHNMQSLSRYLSGGNGYKKCKEIIELLNTDEQKILLSVLDAYAKEQAEEFKELNIGIIEAENNWEKVELTNIIDSYTLNQKGISTKTPYITIIPPYLWIQKITTEGKII